ncbi:MAG: hypothetical protein DRP56_00705 [Planctomycetota bacterium]|nr:MAG: hypothetical protein DRP56_00705 [Planctomycetota bacterium]
MAGTKTLSKEQVNEQLDDIDQKIKYGHIEDAAAIGCKLYAAASADPAVQMVMSNLSEIQQRANDVISQLDDCHGNLNWEQVSNCMREIEVLCCNHKVKKVVFLKIAGLAERFNHITAEALDFTMANSWFKAGERVKEAEAMDPDGIRSRKLRLFYENFKDICESKKTLDYSSQQCLRELFKQFDQYRFSDKSPVFVRLG